MIIRLYASIFFFENCAAKRGFSGSDHAPTLSLPLPSPLPTNIRHSDLECETRGKLLLLHLRALFSRAFLRALFSGRILELCFG